MLQNFSRIAGVVQAVLGVLGTAIPDLSAVLGTQSGGNIFNIIYHFPCTKSCYKIYLFLEVWLNAYSISRFSVLAKRVFVFPDYISIKINN